MADYCTLADIKTAIPESGLVSSSDYDDTLAALITAASRLIDREIGQAPNYFYPSTSDETRYFDGSGEYTQRIDDAISITSVSVAEQGDLTDFTVWSSSDFDYQVMPANYALTGQPIRQLTTAIWNSDKGSFPYAKQAVKVVGIFGYSATPPADVKQAAIIQTVRWFMRSKQAYQDSGANAQVGQTNVTTMDADVKAILYHYLIEGMA